MPDWLTLRRRFALFFAAIALGGSALFAAALWMGYRNGGGPVDGYVQAWLAGSFGLMGLVAWIGYLFDENVARPIKAVAADLQTRAKSDVSVDIDQAPGRYLGALAPAAQAIHEALDDARKREAQILAEKTASLRRDKALLEALIRDLAEGVVVIAPGGEILLYNQQAVDLLGELGIDRQMSRFIGLAPVMEAARRLGTDTAPPAESFLTATCDGGTILTGAVTDVRADDGLVGHVLIFRDATEDLRTHGELDGVLSTLVDAARRPTMTIGAVLDVLEQSEELPRDAVTQFTSAMRDEINRLTQELNRAETEQSAMSDSHWPMRNISTGEIIDALRAGHAEALCPAAQEVYLRCDGFAITRLWEKVLEALHDNPDRRAFRMGVEIDGTHAVMSLAWDGPALRQSALDQAIGARLSDAYGGYRGTDALKAHRTDLWIESGPRLVLPLPLSPHLDVAARAPRPDFYDFAQRSKEGLAGKLSDLCFTVFDTETTGLDPNKDDVVQLAGVRVLRQRCVRGEVFDSLVAPERPIPREASEIHGVTNEMVKDAPHFTKAGLNFAAFAEGSVLVAHHAEFDMAFLNRLKSGEGPMFDNPVLCTARLSSRLYSHFNDHTLDALVDRYGVTLNDDVRHTALGDATATAEVFVKMLPVLAERDVTSLEDALAFQNS